MTTLAWWRGLTQGHVCPFLPVEAENIAASNALVAFQGHVVGQRRRGVKIGGSLLEEPEEGI